jgi:putative cell wall-binding protein
MVRLVFLVPVLALVAGACGDDGPRERTQSYYVTTSTAAGAAASAEVVRRIAGSDRYETATRLMDDRWDSASDVFLANGIEPADALAAAYGSGLHSSPVFLTERDSLSPSAREGLEIIGPRIVHVLGGTASISEGVVAELESAGYDTVRHAGADRFGTAVAVAKSETSEIIGSYRDEGRTVILANGRRPFDALVAGPLSAGILLPILLTEADALPPVTANALRELKIQHVMVMGDASAVSDAVVSSIVATGLTVRRVGGATSAATAVAMAGVLEELDYDLARIALTSGSTPADALGAGPWAAPSTPILLCETPNACGETTMAWVRAHPPREVVVIGGTASVSDAAADEVASTSR